MSSRRFFRHAVVLLAPLAMLPGVLWAQGAIVSAFQAKPYLNRVKAAYAATVAACKR